MPSSSEKMDTVTDAFCRQAERFSDREWLVMDDTGWSFSAVFERSRMVAGALQSFGVGPGDTVGMLLENCPEFLFTWFGANMLGAIEVPVNFGYRGEFLRHQLADSAARVLVIDGSRVDRLKNILGGLPELKQLVLVGEGSDSAKDADWLNGVEVHVFDDLPALAGSGPSMARVGGSDPCAIIYTAGTTGPSKGALMSHNYLVNGMSRTFSELWGQTADDTMYSPLPLFHGNAQTVTILNSLLTGGKAVLDRRFSVSRTWDRVRQYEATAVAILGSMIVMLWNLPPDPRDSKLSMRVLFGAPVPAELHDAIRHRYNCELVAAYGLTEAVPIILGGLTPGIIPGSSGKAGPNFEVILVDDNDNEVPVGSVGEITCRPLKPHIMFEGYFKNPGATVAE